MVQAYHFHRSDTVPRQTQAHGQEAPDEEGALQATAGIAQGYSQEQFLLFNASSNRLVNLSAELLSLLITLPVLKQPMNMAELLEELVERVSALGHQGRVAGFSRGVMDKVCYVLSAALDEGINKTSWGQSGSWENHSLLSRLFRQRNGGEVFFQLLDQARQQPQLNGEFLELMYLLLRLGFEGRYLQQDYLQRDKHGLQESHELSRLSSELYQELRCFLPAPEEQAPPPVNLAWRPFRQFHKSPVLIALPILLLCGYLGAALWIHTMRQSDSQGTMGLQTWKAPARPMGTIYNSTPADLKTGQP